jgi:hypothetical protein
MGIGAGKVKSISVKDIKLIVASNGLAVAEDINAVGSIDRIKVIGGNLSARNITAGKVIENIVTVAGENSGGDIIVNDIQAAEIGNIEAQGAHDIHAGKITVTELPGKHNCMIFAGHSLYVTAGIYGIKNNDQAGMAFLFLTAETGDLVSSVYWEGVVKDIEVGGNFVAVNHGQGGPRGKGSNTLVTAYGIEKIRAGGNIGGYVQNGQFVVGGTIETIGSPQKRAGDTKAITIGGNIGQIIAGDLGLRNSAGGNTSPGGSILAEKIHTEYGYMDSVMAVSNRGVGGAIMANISAHRINTVKGDTISGDITINNRLYITVTPFGQPNNPNDYNGWIKSIQAITLLSKTISARLIGTVKVTGGQQAISTNFLFQQGMDPIKGAIFDFGLSDYTGAISIGYGALVFPAQPAEHRPVFANANVLVTMTALKRAINNNTTQNLQLLGNVGVNVNIKKLIIRWDAGLPGLFGVANPECAIAGKDGPAAGWSTR